jgi:hydrogenase maturation protease
MILVIGIGNEFRGDDGVGFYIARKLKERKLENVDIIEASGEGTELLTIWENRGKTLIVDAVSSGAIAGTIYRFDIQKEPLPTKLFSSQSTHAFGIAEAIELGKTLNRLPSSLVVYGIEGKTFGFGAELSSEVEKAAEDVIARIIGEIL